MSPFDHLNLPFGNPRRAFRRIANERLDDLIESEASRARSKVDTLMGVYPSASPREIAQRLIDEKKQIATAVGGITGVLGLITLPVDLAGMVYLELSLLVEIATVFKVGVRNQSAKDELLDLFGYATGIGPLKRSTPRVVGSAARALLLRGGLKRIGTALPLVAAPVSAYLNNQHIQRIGDAGLRHYSAEAPAREKSVRLGGSS